MTDENQTPWEKRLAEIQAETPTQTIARVRQLHEDELIEDSWGYWHGHHDVGVLLAEIERLRGVCRDAASMHPMQCECEACAMMRDVARGEPSR